MTGEETKALKDKFDKNFREVPQSITYVGDVPIILCEVNSVWQFIESEIITPYEKQLEQVEREERTKFTLFRGAFDMACLSNKYELKFIFNEQLLNNDYKNSWVIELSSLWRAGGWQNIGKIKKVRKGKYGDVFVWLEALNGKTIRWNNAQFTELPLPIKQGFLIKDKSQNTQTK